MTTIGIDLNVPPVAQTLMRSVYASGARIKELPRSAEIKAGEGHRSIITRADSSSNSSILGSFGKNVHIRFLCEEEAPNDPRVLSKEAPKGIFTGSVALVDPLDGTTLFASYFPEWCVGAALLEDGIITTNVITAPEANGGTMLFGYGSEVYLMEKGMPIGRAIRIIERPLDQSVILRGVDTELYGNVTSMMPKIAASVRAAYTMGSGHFGLMSVAFGRAAAIIQTPQKPWDWAPGYQLVTALGGVFRFFRLKDGNLIPVEHYDERAFKAGKENRLGFIAGGPSVVDRLFALLPKTGWERHDPDII
jgi:myo-inositol-1(or 4)-monophosphatase